MSTSRSLTEDRTRQVAAAQRQVFANALPHFPQLSKCHPKKLTPGIPCRTCSIWAWNIDGALAMPYGKRVYLKRPMCVLMVTYFWDSSSNGICWYACDRSNLVKIFPPARAANNPEDVVEDIYIYIQNIIQGNFEISTHSDTIISLGHWYHWCSPVRVWYWH